MMQSLKKNSNVYDDNDDDDNDDEEMERNSLLPSKNHNDNKVSNGTSTSSTTTTTTKTTMTTTESRQKQQSPSLYCCYRTFPFRNHKLWKYMIPLLLTVLIATKMKKYNTNNNNATIGSSTVPKNLQQDDDSRNSPTNRNNDTNDVDIVVNNSIDIIEREIEQQSEMDRSSMNNNDHDSLEVAVISTDPTIDENHSTNETTTLPVPTNVFGDNNDNNNNNTIDNNQLPLNPLPIITTNTTTTTSLDENEINPIVTNGESSSNIDEGTVQVEEEVHDNNNNNSNNNNTSNQITTAATPSDVDEIDGVGVVGVDDTENETTTVFSNIKADSDHDNDENPTTTTTISKGFQKAAAKLSNTYLPRALPFRDESLKKELSEKWGAWTLQPPKPVSTTESSSSSSAALPIDDYPYGDIPRSQFPPDSWQMNTDYLSKWLPESIALVERSLEAILTEYGNGKFDNNQNFTDRMGLFDITLLPTRHEWQKPPYNFKQPPGDAGYATLPTLLGMKRRLLHAIMLEDSFVLAMGGHSASAGHGNHFQQSYTLQAQIILEPILARLGVYHQAHNYGMGGLGTSQNSLAAGDLYGTNLDILIWDSSMTESDSESKDVFVRQAILGSNRGGKKIPVIWGDPYPLYQAKTPVLGAISTGNWGAFMKNMPWTASATQAKDIPWAARYLNCAKEANAVCKNSRYISQCWIDRTDVTPPTKQRSQPNGQASWHPGNRAHQVHGRGIAFIILQQLLAGLKEWYDAEDYALPDKAWHVGDEHERMVQTVMDYNTTQCFKSKYPIRACQFPLYGRSEFTPRYNPAETSIRSIVMEGVKVTPMQPNLYDPPDVRIPTLDPPDDGTVHVLRIIENGIEFIPNKARVASVSQQIPPARRERQRSRQLFVSKTDLPPGQGWGLDTSSAPDNCDGSYDSFCGKDSKNDCLLSGHNDHRGGLLFDGYSGWLKLHLTNVINGLIFVRIEDWTGAYMNPGTAGFKCENNINCDDQNERELLLEKTTTTTDHQQHSYHQNRSLGGNECTDYIFEYAIDGIITSWNQTEFDMKRQQPQRVVHLWTFLDDPTYTLDKPTKDVELAIRLKGCGRMTTFSLTHVYWT